jgi:DNA helicase MCM8
MNPNHDPPAIPERVSNGEPNHIINPTVESSQSSVLSLHSLSHEERNNFISQLSHIWTHYFPEESLDEDQGKVELIYTIRSFFASRHYIFLHDFARSEIIENHRIMLDYNELVARFPIQDFKDTVENSPNLAFSCIGAAIHSLILNDPKAASFGKENKLNVRIANYGPSVHIRRLNSQFIDKFVSIKACVVRTGAIKPLVEGMKFHCERCGSEEYVVFSEGIYNTPFKCSGVCLKKKHFGPPPRYVPIPDKKQAKTKDYQAIRVQEVLQHNIFTESPVSKDYSDDSSRIPKPLDCELYSDLVDSCIPGDIVILAGTIRQRKESNSYKNKNLQLYSMYMEINNIVKIGSNSAINNDDSNAGGHNPAKLSSKLELTEFGTKDLQGILKLRFQPQLFKFLLNSLCPNIYGHELVKAGLLLALFGGSNTRNASRSAMFVRECPHILVVGDPGLGKSQMLRSVIRVAPRGVYVSAGSTNTSKSGLTITMIRDSNSEGDYSLEGGALVLGDQGITAIDEFDKLGSDDSALLEAMEQQTISIAKAGIVCTLSAKTSVLAAANPVGGHYNTAKSVSENLKISNPLLSRFDLIFILLDKPNPGQDQLLSEHIIGIHSGRKHAPAPNPSSNHGQSTNSDQKLAQRLKLKGRLAESFAPCPAYLLRKYIAYARRFVQPTLSPESKKIFEEYYLSLRKTANSVDGTPITTRQLESMIRLAEARARVELSELVTEQHALEIVDLMQESWKDITTDERGAVDYTRINGTMSKGKATHYFIGLLRKRSRQNSCFLWSKSELQLVAEEARAALCGLSLTDLIDNCNQHGFLLNKGGGNYQVIE